MNRYGNFYDDMPPPSKPQVLCYALVTVGQLRDTLSMIGPDCKVPDTAPVEFYDGATWRTATAFRTMANG